MSSHARLPFKRSGLALGLALSLAAAGCGAGDDAAGRPEKVVVREQNEVRLDGLVYRVPIFRQLNPRITPDSAYYDGPPAPDGSGTYAAFVRVCNPGGSKATPTDAVYLEDAFGERFRPVPLDGDPVAYEPEPLDRGECLPPASAGTTAEGAVVPFHVPFRSVQERPLTLVLEGRDGERVARVELDV